MSGPGEERNVPLVRTPVSMVDYAYAAIRAWQDIYDGALPEKAQIGVLWSQYGVETGAGDSAACWAWNIGNVKHVPGDGFDYVMLHNVPEYVKGRRVIFQPPHPATWFRAYPDLRTAMTEHLRFLRNKRYAPAWPAVEKGDAHLFAFLLKRAGYYTATPEAYAAGMRPHMKRWTNSDAFERALERVRAEDAPRPDQLEPEPAIVHAFPDPPKRDES